MHLFRAHQNLRADANAHLTESLLSELADWQEYASIDGAWDSSRHEWQRRLIAATRGREPHLPGMLYRATIIDDSAAAALIAGKPGVLKPGKSKLSSWSKTTDGAFAYFDAIDTENLSAALIMMPAHAIHAVFDFDTINDPVEAHEVLAVNAKLRLRPENIVALAFCDYDVGEETTYHLAPDLSIPVDIAEIKTHVSPSSWLPST
jgi:hypothetical protein